MKINQLINDKQKDFILARGLGFDWDNPSDDDLIRLEDKVGDILQNEGLTDDQENINDVGRMCYSILDLMHLVDD